MNGPTRGARFLSCKTSPCRRRWLPLLLLLVAVGLFDLIAITSLSSLQSQIFASVLAISYTQSLLSSIWLVSGVGKLATASMSSGSSSA